MSVRFGYGLAYASSPERHFVYLKNARLLWYPMELMRFFGPDRDAFFSFLRYLQNSEMFKTFREEAEPDRPLQFVIARRGGVLDMYVAVENWRRLRRRLKSL